MPRSPQWRAGGRFALVTLVAGAAVGAALVGPPESAAQPYLLRDIRTFGAAGAVPSSVPGRLGSVGSRVVFSTETRFDFLEEVWSTDGTAAGTQRLPILWNDPDESVEALGTVGGRLVLPDGYDFAGDGPFPWATDGTLAGTERIVFHPTSGFAPGRVGALPGSGPLLLRIGGPAGAELWATDATLAGTRMVRDLEPGSGSSFPAEGARAGGAILFAATTAAGGRELWRSDGTAAGTYLLRDLAPGINGSFPQDFTTVGALALLTADDGVHGRELWVSDGTAAGAKLLGDLTAGPATTDLEEGPVIAGGRAYFTADTGAGRRLWVTDGVAFPAPVTASTPSFPANLAAHAGRLFFSAFDTATGTELWVTATPAPTLVRDLCPGP